jgi:pimeloyl-ACP methyl ester carboxylesterase
MQLEELQYTAKARTTDAFGLLSRFLVMLFPATKVFPSEIYRAPKCWAERAYHKLINFHEVDKGGHFAAWEQPELFAAELRAAFSSLR